MVSELEVGHQFLYSRLLALVGGTDDRRVYAYPADEDAVSSFYTFLYQSSRRVLASGGRTVSMAPLYLVTYHCREDKESLRTAIIAATAIERGICTTEDAATPGPVTITDSGGATYAVDCYPEPGRGAFEQRGPAPDGVLYNRVGGFYRLIIQV